MLVQHPVGWPPDRMEMFDRSAVSSRQLAMDDSSGASHSRSCTCWLLRGLRMLSKSVLFHHISFFLPLMQNEGVSNVVIDH